MERFFDDILKSYIRGNKYKCFCEIGARFGDNSDNLLRLEPINLTIIDPCIDEDLVNKYGSNGNVRVYKGLSLQMLPKISERFDCIFIDGDHNWFTVFNELRIVEENNLLQNGGTIFLHDVWWPYGRRDVYYFPETIPDKFRHPYARRGMLQGKSQLVDSGGVNRDFHNAEYEGGERNGVLTAIEDFLKIYKRKYIFFYIRHEHGLGILIKRRGLITFFVFAKWVLICRLCDAWWNTLKPGIKKYMPGIMRWKKLINWL